MTSWKDICREKNGPDVCDTPDVCKACLRAAFMKRLARFRAIKSKEQE